MTLKAAIKLILALLLLLPVSIILTFMLLPFWSWLEATSGIEAVGHASLSEWCFGATYAALSLVWLIVRVRTSRGRKADRE